MNEKGNLRVAFFARAPAIDCIKSASAISDGSQLSRRLRQGGLRLGAVKGGSFVFHRFFGGTSG